MQKGRYNFFNTCGFENCRWLNFLTIESLTLRFLYLEPCFKTKTAEPIDLE